MQYNVVQRHTVQCNVIQCAVTVKRARSVTRARFQSERVAISERRRQRQSQFLWFSARPPGALFVPSIDLSA
eukprot:8234929-Lingulodinium_polyedra.AAC.1